MLCVETQAAQLFHMVPTAVCAGADPGFLGRRFKCSEGGSFSEFNYISLKFPHGK